MGFQTAFPIPFMYQMIIAVILNLCAGILLNVIEETCQNSENKILSHRLEENVLCSVLELPQLVFCHLFHTGLRNTVA